VVQVLFQFAFVIALLFVASGDLRWVEAWAYVGVGVLVLIANGVFLSRYTPEVMAERAEVGKNTKPWDRLLTSVYGAATLLTLLVAGLDRRLVGASSTSPLVSVVGLAGVALGNGLATWAMVSNAYFATTVRIQGERGHRVTTGGPYRYVRHPGYVGWSISAIATPFGLGTLWALVPAGAMVLALLVRTALEDRTLHEELDGYHEYAQQTRYRLLPGVW